jgi:hypothetical protein
MKILQEQANKISFAGCATGETRKESQREL